MIRVLSFRVRYARSSLTGSSLQWYSDIEDLLQINREVRDKIEASESEKVAMQICSRLPKNEAEIADMIETGYELARKMSWDVVVQHYLLPSLQQMTARLKVA